MRASFPVGAAWPARPRTAKIWIVRTFAVVAAAVVSASASSAPAATTLPPPPAPADTQLIVSPDAHLQATITITEDVRYALTLDGTPLVLPSPVSLSLADGRVLGRGARVVRVDRREISEEIPTPIGKRAKVRNACRELAILLSDGATLRARVFDDGFALRWETALPGRIRVRDEGFSIAFRDEPTMFFLGGEGAHHGYEGLWRHEPISTLAWSTQTASLPLVVDLSEGLKLGVLQADLDDYPAMYLATRPSQPQTLSASFPRRVIKEQPGGYMNFLGLHQKA